MSLLGKRSPAASSSSSSSSSSSKRQAVSTGDVIQVRVGHRKFHTTLTTLRAGGGMLERMFSDDYLANGMTKKSGDGSYFIDRNPAPFAQILSYLRSWKVEEFKKTAFNANWSVTREELVYYTDTENKIDVPAIDFRMTGVCADALTDLCESKERYWKTVGAVRCTVFGKAHTHPTDSTKRLFVTTKNHVAAEFYLYRSDKSGRRLPVPLLRQLRKALCGKEWERDAVETFIARLFGARNAWLCLSTWANKTITLRLSLEWSLSALPGEDDERVKAMRKKFGRPAKKTSKK